jgi:hypothetical protein
MLFFEMDGASVTTPVVYSFAANGVDVDMVLVGSNVSVHARVCLCAFARSLAHTAISPSRFHE